MLGANLYNLIILMNIQLTNIATFFFIKLFEFKINYSHKKLNPRLTRHKIAIVSNVKIHSYLDARTSHSVINKRYFKKGFCGETLVSSMSHTVPKSSLSFLRAAFLFQL